MEVPPEERAVALRRASRRYGACGLILLLLWGAFWVQRHREQRGLVSVQEALDAGHGVGGRMRTPGEARYEWWRGKVLFWGWPYGVLLLGFAWLRRMEASEAEQENQGSGD